MSIILRRCTTCKKEKPLSKFFKDKIRKYGHRYQCKECGGKYQRTERYKKYRREWQKKHPDYWRKQHYKIEFGSSLEEYNELFEKQNGCCAICERHQTELKKRLAVDHIYNTKQIRGLLCEDCNLGIGRLKDNIEILKKAIVYLQKGV